VGWGPISWRHGILCPFSVYMQISSYRFTEKGVQKSNNDARLRQRLLRPDLVAFGVIGDLIIATATRKNTAAYKSKNPLNIFV